MLPAATTATPLTGSERSNPFFAPTELRRLVLGGEDDSFTTGLMYSLLDAAVEFVEKEIGNHLVSKQITDSWPRWATPLSLSVRWQNASIQNPELSYLDASGQKQALAQQEYHLSTTGMAKVVPKTAPALFALETNPVSFAYKFVAPAPPGAVREATGKVWQAMFEAKYAAMPFKTAEVQQSIGALLRGYRRAA